MHKPTLTLGSKHVLPKTMDENPQAQPEATTEGQEQEPVINLEEEVSSEPAEELVPKSQFNQVLARAKKAEEALKKRTQQLPEKKEDDIHQTVQELKLAETKRQFGYEHGLSPEETDAVFRINPKPTKETLEDPFVKGGLQAIRAKKKVAENTPRSSHSTGFSLPKKELTPEEKQREFEKFRKDRLGI